MASTQMIRCVECGKVLGSLNALTGDFKSIAFNTQWGKTEQVMTRDEKEQNKVIKRTVTKSGYKVDKKSKYNLIDNAVENIQPTITCSCGQANGIY